MIIADTGFWLALANAKDNHHKQARAALASLKEPLITTWLVMGETCHLLLSRLGESAQIAFMKSFAANGWTIFELRSTHGERICDLMEKYRDLPMDLTDASLVIVAEEIGSGRILSTDSRDFGAYRWKQRKPFKNLLL